METDTHTIFLGKVLDADQLSGQEPMTYAYYHKVVKGKSPKNAPTYLPEEDTTHTIFLGKVLDADQLSGQEPMTYAYYHKVVKGKSPKNAPTYLPEEDTSAKSAWVCSVCGYIYDGETPFEELPEDYTCPICRQPKSVFIRK